MNEPLSWALGAGGLLGSCVDRELGENAFRPGSPLPWHDSNALREAFAREVARFGERVRSGSARGWSVYWCAGAGVVGTSRHALDGETENLRVFLECLKNSGDLRSASGRIFLASSAGGVYAGSDGRPLTESTLPRPISDYGKAKLEQESVLESWASRMPRVSTLIGRFSNLYGLGQRLDKPQGLISQISRCLIFAVPVQIYVPLDTQRDYLFAEDGARMAIAAMNRLVTDGSSAKKIFASEYEISIAGLIGVFRRMAKRQLKLVLGLRPASSAQPAKLQFRSLVWADDALRPRTLLAEGIKRVHAHQMRLNQQGRLPRPVAV